MCMVAVCAAACLLVDAAYIGLEPAETVKLVTPNVLALQVLRGSILALVSHLAPNLA
jgi:hypothetical protein